MDDWSDMIEEALDNGTVFGIVRGSRRVAETRGAMLYDTGTPQIMFGADVDVREGDWLIDEGSPARPMFFVTQTQPVKDGGRALYMKAWYENRTDHMRREAGPQLVAMLDDIASAIAGATDEQIPPEQKRRGAALLKELQDVVKTIPSGVAGGIAGEIASRFSDGG